MKNASVVNKIKIWTIITLVIVVAGMALLGFLGLNKTYEFTGGTEVKVEIAISDEANKTTETITNETNAVLSNKGLKAQEITKIDEESTFIFKIQKQLEDADLSALKTEIESALTAKLTDIDVEVAVSSTYAKMDMQKVWMAIAACAVALVFAWIYMAIRYKVAAATTVFSAGLISVLFMVALTAITRAPVTANYLAMVFASLLFTLVLSIIFVSNAKKEEKNAANEESTKMAISEIALKHNLVGVIALAIAVLLVSIALIIFGEMSVKFLGIQLVLAVVSSVFVSVCLTSWLWAFYAGVGKKNK